MIKSEIKIKPGQRENFDKKEITLANRDASHEDEVKCPFLEEAILKNCYSCSLKIICDGIDNVVGKVH